MPSLIKQLRKATPIAWLVSLLIRAIARTMRLQVDDRCGITREGAIDRPVIWIFWHNRAFLVPYIYSRFLSHRRGFVLTSPSDDGGIIAGVMKRFGVDAIRGSSNKRPAAAFREMVRELRRQADIAITPDGPRGPRYEMQPGAVKLAQATGVPLCPVHIGYQNAWHLETWDRFAIPKPFSRATVILGPLVAVNQTTADEAFEVERHRVQDLLRNATADPGA